MVIAFSSSPFGKSKSDDFKQIGDLQANGTVQWGPTDPDGRAPDHPQTVLSVQPDGSYETRPLGTADAFEVFTFDGSALTIRPNKGGFDGPTVGYVISARALP